MEKLFIINGTLYAGESVSSFHDTKPGDEIIVHDETVYVLKPKMDNQADSIREHEQLEYDSRLDEYLIDGINYEANTISKADADDLEQFAADSFFEGWEHAKRFFQNQGFKIL